MLSDIILSLVCQRRFLIECVSGHVPQTRHKEFQNDLENGGFLRVSAGRYFVANFAKIGRFFPDYFAK